MRFVKSVEELYSTMESWVQTDSTVELQLESVEELYSSMKSWVQTDSTVELRIEFVK